MRVVDGERERGENRGGRKGRGWIRDGMEGVM